MKPTPITVLLAVTSAAAFASPSGLNNIPTADTAPQGTFVLQTYGTVSGQAATDLNIGFKTGLDFKYAHIELGVDSHIRPDEGGPMTLNGKLAIPLGEHLPTLALGGANATFRNVDRARAGDQFFYGVLSEDLGCFRVHAGCGLQNGVAQPFYGIDRTFRCTKQVAASDGKKFGKTMMTTRCIDLFTLRGDAIEELDSSWLYSAGVVVPLCKYFVFETWGNFPDNGSPSLTIKGNFVFAF